MKTTLCWAHGREGCKICFQKLLSTRRRPQGLLVEVTLGILDFTEAASSSGPLPCTPLPLPSRAPVQVDLFGQRPCMDQSPRLQDRRCSLWPLVAAELQQEGVDKVWEEIQELVVHVRLLDQEVDGAQGL